MTKEKLAILVGGGPAPGINSVISAATIRALLQGVEVLGIRDGFSNIMRGRTDLDAARPLRLEDVSRIHFTGGSILGTARANPTKDVKLLDAVIESLVRLGVTQLITIGGDDTAFSAMKVAERAAGRVRVAHVPKTIDNDLDLDPNVDTFGYQTARHIGVEIVKNLMVDAKTTSRWYFAIAMGRKAGHLALGIGKAAGATLTLIPEEFPKFKTNLQTLADTLAGAIIKRRAEGHHDGVAVLAEGLVESLPEDDLKQFGNIELDDHGHVRFSEIDIGDVIKRATAKRLKDLRHQDDHRLEEHRLRAPLRRPGADGHGVHPRPGLLRRQVPVLAAATPPWCRCRAGTSSPSRSPRCWTRRPAAPACAWWTSTPPATPSPAAT